jgi:hypothetical protein
MKGASAAVARRKPKYYRKTERLLYDYKTLDLAIRMLEAELESIMPQTSTSIVKLGEGSAVAPFESQTEEWAIKRIESPRAKRILKLLAEKKRWHQAIKEIRQQLTDEENTLVWMRYDLEKPHQEIWEAMHMSRANYFRFKDEVIGKIARYLGLL